MPVTGGLSVFYMIQNHVSLFLFCLSSQALVFLSDQDSYNDNLSLKKVVLTLFFLFSHVCCKIEYDTIRMLRKVNNVPIKPPTKSPNSEANLESISKLNEKYVSSKTMQQKTTANKIPLTIIADFIIVSQFRILLNFFYSL